MSPLGQVAHTLSSIGVGGRVYLPLSMARLWALVLSLANARSP